jgi:HisA/HisF family protein
MEVIPVIDLKGGCVVRARMGRRHEYRPIETPLSRSSDPVAVAEGLLSVYPFRTLYIADLGAIEGHNGHAGALERLQQRFPQLALWVDNGIADADSAAAWLAGGSATLVLGSETQPHTTLIRDLAAHARVVLSLDFRGDAFQGPAGLLATPQLWPRRLIVMTLARVGSGAGPDLARLAVIRAAAPGHALYAAGGVRDRDDLTALKHAGAVGVLVASALHDGRLGTHDIAAVEGSVAGD